MVCSLMAPSHSHGVITGVFHSAAHLKICECVCGRAAHKMSRAAFDIPSEHLTHFEGRIDAVLEPPARITSILARCLNSFRQLSPRLQILQAFISLSFPMRLKLPARFDTVVQTRNAWMLLGNQSRPSL